MRGPRALTRRKLGLHPGVERPHQSPCHAVVEPLLLTILVCAYALFFGLERVFALRQPKARLLPRLATNIVVSMGALVAALILVSPATGASLDRAARSSLGLMHLLALPAVLELATTFLLLDLSFYYWHVANHRIAFLWRFHNVHHVDPDLDTTTAFRFHFVEVALSAGFRVVQVLVIGPAIAAYAAYELCFQLGTLFHHSNLRLPLRFERLLALVLVTPRMHGIHHSQIRSEVHSNFGVVFSCWDRLHRTLRLDVPQAGIAIGVPGYARPQDNLPHNCLALPFRRQREYWPAQ